ncbi:MAG: AAA family ATPase [Pseudonocardiales bacterium]
MTETMKEAVMLLSFRVANVLSFRDEQRISFVATERNDGSARQTGIRDRGKEISVVPVLGIYGANASGKTNVLAALRLMRATVLGSLLAAFDTGTTVLVDELDASLHPPRRTPVAANSQRNRAGHCGPVTGGAGRSSTPAIVEIVLEPAASLCEEFTHVLRRGGPRFVRAGEMQNCGGLFLGDELIQRDHALRVVDEVRPLCERRQSEAVPSTLKSPRTPHSVVAEFDIRAV